MTDREIDLNADLGETDGDLALLDVVTSANVACGGHAGDARSMTAAVQAALARGVTIGAHPSYHDRENFGRRELSRAPREIVEEVADQLAELKEVASVSGTTVSYVKLHGALYHRAGRDAACAEAVLQGIDRAGLAPLPLLAQPGSILLRLARAQGWVGVEEGFCDRAYRADGSLVDRSVAGAVLAAAEAERQAVGLAITGGVRADDGTWLSLRPASLCIHGDTPAALELAGAVRRSLQRAGAVIAPFVRP